VREYGTVGIKGTQCELCTEEKPPRHQRSKEGREGGKEVRWCCMWLKVRGLEDITEVHRKVQGRGPWVAKERRGISRYSSDLDVLPLALCAHIVIFHAVGQSCSFASVSSILARSFSSPRM